MAQELNIGLPQGLDVGPNYTIRVTGIDPTTGSVVSGVNVNKVVFTVAQIQGTPDQLQTGSWLLVPGPNA